MMSIGKESKIGFILEVDLEYPDFLKCPDICDEINPKFG